MPHNADSAAHLATRQERNIGSNPLRPLAIDLTIGQTVALTLDGTAVPARITRLIPRPNGSIFADVDVFLRKVAGRVRWDAHSRVGVLPAHYGICVECGALSPCPHQAIEEHAAQLHAESDPINALELSFHCPATEEDPSPHG